MLNGIGAVSEAAACGVPDAHFGEAIIAAVVPKPAVEVYGADLRKEIEPRLARFKHPRIYRFLDTLPRNTMGKVQKNVLRDRFKS